MTDGRSWALVVDDHPMCRAAAQVALEITDADLLVTAVGTLAEAVDAIGGERLSIVCLDLSLPDSDGFAGFLKIQRAAAGVPVVVISAYDQPEVVRQAYRLEAAGFVSKAEPIATLIDAFRAVLLGYRWFGDHADAIEGEGGDIGAERLRALTPAQRRVLDAMAGGDPNKQIAFDLGLSEITVKAHVKEILRKLGVENRTQAILMDRTLRMTHLPFGPSVNPKG